MSIDFSSLVLGPCEDTFGQPITIQPTRSQPGSASYTARGIWESRRVEVMLEDGTIVSSNEIDVGIRLSEFIVPPTKFDGVVVSGRQYHVYDLNFDGQGGLKLILRLGTPPT